MSTQRRPFRRLIWAVILVLAALGLGVALLLVVRPAPADFTLAGSARQMGQQHGSAFKHRIRLLASLYLHRIVCQNNPDLIRDRETYAATNATNWSPVYHDELAGIGEATGLPQGTLAYANLFLDLGNRRAGCRSAVVVRSNLVLHAHNLDWDNLAGLGRWSTTILRRNPDDGRFRTVSVGFPGMVGALDIINEKGLALSFNQLGIGRGAVNEPVLLMIRRIAETCSSLPEARTQILSAGAGMPFIITVSDAANATGSVFERAKDTILERPLGDGWVAACNQAQGSQSGATRLDALLAGSPVQSHPDLQRVLSDPQVLMECNIYSVTFDFHHNRFYLSSGAIPAASAPARIYPLFE